MILNALRINHHLSQEQLAQMSGLNVRTIQRIESGQKASLESQKCLAAALDMTVEQLNQETFMIDKQSHSWKKQPVWVKWWFFLNYLSFKPRRKSTSVGIVLSHLSGFTFCMLALKFGEGALIGGLLMLIVGYFLQFLLWQGDHYGVWYDQV